MKCEKCRLIRCEQCGEPIGGEIKKPAAYPSSQEIYQPDDFSDTPKTFRQANGRDPYGEEWAMFH